MAPKLEHTFTMRGYMSKENSLDLKAIKSGPSRNIVPITHGFLKGHGRAEGLEAQLMPGGGDWILLDPSTSVAHLDVRTQAKTSDGESIYVYYTGVLKIDEATGKILGWSKDAKSTAYGDHEWWSGPIIETSSQKHKWVETSLFVGQGHWVVDDDGSQAVEYQIYKLVN